MATILRRLSRPLLQLGDLAFDLEVSARRGGEREVTERRIAAGASVADHSRRPARVFEIEGAVSALAQPQNLGRPGADPTAIATTAAINVFSEIAPDLDTRLADFEQRLDALLDDDVFGELELVSAVVGRLRVVLLRWEATNSPGDGEAATYRLTVKELRRAGLTIAQATDAALALNGSGGGPQPGGGGPSQATPVDLDVVP